MRNTIPEKPITGLWYLLKGYKSLFFGSIISQFIIIIIDTARLFILRFIVDDVIGTLGWQIPLLIATLVYIGFVLLIGVLSFLSSRGFSVSAEGLIRDLRNDFFDHIQRLSFAYHDESESGDLVQRSSSDIGIILGFYKIIFRNLAAFIFIFIINFIAIFVLNWKLLLVSIALTPAFFLVAVIFFRRIGKAQEIYQDQEGTLSSLVQENLSGSRVVRAFSRQKFEIKKFETENIKNYRYGLKVGMNHTFFWPISDSIAGVQYVVSYLFAAILVFSGEISIGTFIAFAGMMGSIMWPLREIGRIFTEISKVSISYKRLSDIIGEEQEDYMRGISEKKLKGDVLFQEVSFEYKDEIPVLEDISFSAGKGNIIVLIGRAGSGKTTLVNLLPRFYDYIKGEVFMDGKPLKTYSRHFLRRNIGIVEQEPFLFSTSIRENITYGAKREISQEEVERAAKIAAIHDHILSFPYGYDTRVGEKGVTLSGGEKQRIAIARALLKEPAILILDDFTSSVDVETEQKIRNAIEILMKGRTTFIITHRVKNFVKADLILVFQDGKIIQRGTHDDLIKEEGFYRKIFDLQSQIEIELEEELRNV
ncbi:MAG: ABC transporter ATP-binding protein [Promethearchaeota archaeon]|jgi:ATP-binding cassette subfamily B protein